jgi:PTH1 family peptidyl-tRNA hydrolase
MKLIIGLGNPENQYAGTRHNIGFELLDEMRTTWDFPAFEHNKKFNAEITKGKIVGHEALLAKPQTFMNISGDAVRKLLEFYKLSLEDIIVLHDDLDIPLGKFKVATDSSSAGHNGVKSIIEMLGTQKFKRLRVGIGEEQSGAPVCKLNAHDFVLGKFTPAETEQIKKISADILEATKGLL